MTPRSLAWVRAAPRQDIGDLETRMPLTDAEAGDRVLDPFLLLAHHGPQQFAPNNAGLPFGPHPHRGFETVTFVLDGALVHADTGGHQSLIDSGGVQWMTAGSGLVHNETVPSTFRRHGGSLEILQLWVNLPSRLKMTPPRYTGVQADAIPAIALDDQAGTLDLVAGSFDGSVGPVETLTDVFMSTVTLKAGAAIDLPAPADRTVLCYVVRGKVTIGERAVAARDIAAFAADGDAVRIVADHDALILFGHAMPIGEPVVARGPFVMTTEAEIDEAERDYRAGRFADAPLSVELG